MFNRLLKGKSCILRKGLRNTIQPPILMFHLVAIVFPPHFTRAQIYKLKSESKYYVWDDSYLWRFCSDQIIRRCVPNHEFHSVLSFCYAFACGGHFRPQRTAGKF